MASAAATSFIPCDDLGLCRAPLNVGHCRILSVIATVALIGPNGVNAQVQRNTELIDGQTFTSFREYQEARPWVSLLEFSQHPRGMPDANALKADGAIQPGGYYLRHWTNSPASSNLIVWGLSDAYEWEYAEEWRNVCYSPRTSWTNVTGSLNYNHYEDLELVARLGLPRTFPDHFTWIGEKAFSFQGPFGMYTGIVTQGSSDRPIKLVCVLSNAARSRSREYSIHYHYSNGIAFPPLAFDTTLKTRAGVTQWRTELHEMVLGIVPDQSNGYQLRALVSDDVVFRNIYFMSNRVRYVLLPDGTTSLYKYSTLIEDSARPVRNSILIAFVAIIATGGALMTRWRRT